MAAVDAASPSGRSGALWQSSRMRYMLIAGGIIALVLVLLWAGGFFMGLRLRLNDIYYAPAATSDTIVLIAADDASLRRYGRTPAEWPRTVYADLANALADAGARVLALDLLLSEPQPDDTEVALAFSALRQSESRTRIVLADAGVGSTAPVSGVQALPFSLDLGISPDISAAADFHGYTNALPDVDGVIRRHPSLVRVNGEDRLSFSLAIYYAYLRIPSSAVGQLLDTQSTRLALTPERTIPVDALGMWQPYYFSPPTATSSGAFTVVSLVDVLDGQVDSALFADKIVMVGLMDTTGALDEYLVPSSANGSLMAGVEVQANAVESLLQGRTVQPLSATGQITLIILLTVGASAAYALPRWYVKLGLMLAFVFGWLLITSVVSSASLVTVSLFDTLLALVLPVLASVGIDITLETRQRQQTEFLLSSLHRIAAQRLQLDQAADYILADVMKIVPGAAVALYVHDTAGDDRWLRFRKGEPSASGSAVLADPALTYHQNQQGVTSISGETVVPLVWQGRQNGLIFVAHPTQTRIDPTAQSLLTELAQEVAPHIDNMLLYDEVGRQKTLLDSVFAESPAGIAIIDAAGTVVRCNQDLLQFLEMTLPNVQGKSLPELLALKADPFGDLHQRILNGIKANTLFTLDELKLGPQFARVVVAPLQAYDLWTVIVGDVTALVELSNLKTRMLRIASHDLKNPLARIKGFVDLIFMMTTTLDERDRKYLTLISEAGDEMLRIIDDILNLERMRSGKLLLSDINLSQVVREVCSRHQPDLIQKEQTLDIVMPDEAITVRADAAQLSQAITNYVGNAIKYTPQGGRVVVRLTAEGQRVRFEVEDSGYGIPAKAQPKIFTEFYRAKAEGTLHIPGTGLGLSLVKSVIEAHGGEVGFTSAEGVGSTFFFLLPEQQTAQVSA